MLHTVTVTYYLFEPVFSRQLNFLCVTTQMVYTLKYSLVKTNTSKFKQINDLSKQRTTFGDNCVVSFHISTLELQTCQSKLSTRNYSDIVIAKRYGQNMDFRLCAVDTECSFPCANNLCT